MLKSIKNNFIIGRVRINVTGLSPEKLVNSASSKGIILYNVNRTEYTAFSAEVSSADFKRLKSLFPENVYKFNVTGHSGEVNKFNVNKKRIVLFLGIVIATAALMVLSRHTFKINVYGSSDAEKIKQQLISDGLIDWYWNLGGKISASEQKLTENNPEVLWSFISVKGVCVDVFIKEDTGGKIIQPSQGHVVAAKDCVIRNLIVSSGTAMVQNGQTVSKGQVLIDDKAVLGENEYKVTASGKAIASVWYIETGEVLCEQTVKQFTGNTHTTRILNVFGMNVALGGGNPFSSYQEEVTNVLSSNLPISIKEVCYRETVDTLKTVDVEREIKLTEKELCDKIFSYLPSEAKVAEINTTTEEENGIIKVYTYVETIEDVAQYN